ncbi:hypothetical protein BGZ98_003178 [Dissophora globulifera]|nr:hypothetical protein BGZ98_003178 [Dissophora globulifera]
MQAQLEIYHDQMEQLYRRKARVEIEVEDLQSEKQVLSREKDELREQVEQLRREKQELLQARADTTAATANPAMATTKTSTTALLEKALSDRVAMLVQETARLEVVKRQLESETNRRSA